MPNNIDKQEIDRVLQQKRKQRESKACYACRQRKVKCDGTHPCRTCRRRGHPQICAYDVSSASQRESGSGGHGRRTNELDPGLNWTPESGQRLSSQGPSESPSQNKQSHNQEPARGLPQDNWPNQPDGGEKGYIFSGDNSVVSILQQRTQDANGAMAREVGSVLGLQNSYNNYPFMDSRTPQERWESLLQIFPQRNEVLKWVSPS